MSKLFVCCKQGKNVKSIIDDWNNELQEHSQAFVTDAQELADWDKPIRNKRRELLELEANLNRVSFCRQCNATCLHPEVLWYSAKCCQVCS